MKTNHRKTSSARCLGTVDVKDLCLAVTGIDAALWDVENAGKPNKFTVLDDTRHIIFRFVDSVFDHRKFRDFALWEKWSGVINPVLQEATRYYGYPRGAFPRIMLAKMNPGGVIHPHVDAGPAAGFPHKIHVPLATNENVSFFIDGKCYHFEVGKAYEVNNRVTHSVRNDGVTPRIHLIFEYYDMDQVDFDVDGNR